MSTIGRVRAWVRAIVLRHKVEREMHEEMRAHIEQAAERFAARGISKRDAMYAARREFGPISAIQEQARNSRGGQWVDNFTTDVRYAFRYFARTPFVTATIVFTLMLGVGMSAAGFSLMNAVFFQPPSGIPRNGSVVVVRGLQRVDGAVAERLFSLSEVEAYANNSAFEMSTGWRIFEGIADIREGGTSVGPTRATYVLPSFLQTLGVGIVAGSGLYPPDSSLPNRPDLTAVIDFQLARDRFGGAKEAIGQIIHMNDVAITVVGVTAKGFGGVRSSATPTLYMPLSAMRVVENAREPWQLSNDSMEFRIVARLRDKSSVNDVRPFVTNVAAQFARMHNMDLYVEDLGADVVPLRANNDVRPKTQNTEDIIGTAVLGVLNLLVLLVCTTTVSSLLVGSAVTRSHEIGVRLALGAGRTRIIRQLLTESAILSLTGGALGLALFAVLCRAFVERLVGLELTPTWSTAAFTVLFAIFAAVLCGMSPALHATRRSLSDVLQESQSGTSSRTRLQRAFVIAQIAIAQPVLVALAMFTVLVVQEIRREAHFTLNGNMIVAELDENSSDHFAGAAAEMKNLVERMRRLPGVNRVIPWSADYGGRTPVEMLTVPEAGIAIATRSLSFEIQSVAPEYFEIMEIPVIAGRRFSWRDSSAQIQPIIVSSDFGMRILGTSNVLGRQFCFMRCGATLTDHQRYEVVGVVPARALGAADDSRAVKVFGLYPNTEAHDWLIRTTGSPSATIAEIHHIARSEAPHVPVRRIATIADRNRDARDEIIRLAGVAASGGLIMLLLGCIGLYAVVELAVKQRQREIGIRIALGARSSQVVGQFFNGGLRLSLAGLVIGLPLSAAAIRIIGNQIGLPKTNTTAIALFIAAVVVLVAAFATWLPARKAAAFDPLIALRSK